MILASVWISVKFEDSDTDSLASDGIKI